MKQYLLAILACTFLLPACTKSDSSLSSTVQDKADLVAKMAAYGYKLYTGTANTAFDRVEPMSFEAFKKSPLAGLHAAILASPKTGGLIEPDVLPSQITGQSLPAPTGGVYQGVRSSWSWNLTFPVLDQAGFPRLAVIMANGNSGDPNFLISSSYYQGVGGWSYGQTASHGGLNWLNVATINGTIFASGILTDFTTVNGVQFYQNYSASFQVNVLNSVANATAFIMED